MTKKSDDDPESHGPVTPVHPCANEKRNLEQGVDEHPKYFSIQAATIRLDEAKIAGPRGIYNESLIDASAEGERPQDQREANRNCWAQENLPGASISVLQSEDNSFVSGRRSRPIFRTRARPPAAQEFKTEAGPTITVLLRGDSTRQERTRIAMHPNFQDPARPKTLRNRTRSSSQGWMSETPLPRMRRKKCFFLTSSYIESAIRALVNIPLDVFALVSLTCSKGVTNA
jgi:hypothetical protein